MIFVFCIFVLFITMYYYYFYCYILLLELWTIYAISLTQTNSATNQPFFSPF